MSVSDQEAHLRSAKFENVQATVLALRSSLNDSLGTLEPEDNINPSHVTKTVQAVVFFLSHDIVREAYLTAPQASLGRHPVNDSFLNTLHVTSDELQRYLESQEQLNHVYVVLGYFHDAFDQAQERNSRTQHRFLGPQQQAELDNALHEAIAQFEEVQKETSTEAAIRRLEQAATQAEASATAASKAAGKTADDTVSSHFQSMAANEAEAADKFRLWTMAAMGLGGIIATIYLLGPVVGLSGLEIGTGDYVHLLQRVLVVGAIFAFAAYTGRQAHNHRTQANWADSLAVQLQSFDAYCDAIADQASKDQLRTTFAARAFGEHPALRGGSSPESGDALIQKAADLVSKIIPGDKS